MAPSEKTNKLNMLLALALAERKRAEPTESAGCPDAETIACYFDGALTTDEKEQFLKQLRNCPDSYAQWIATADALGYPYEALQKTKISADSLTWTQKLANWFSTSHKILAAAAVTCFALIVVVNLELQQVTLEQQISNHWQENQQLYVAHMDVSEFLAQRQTKSTLTIVPFADKTAFGKGFKEGLELIYHKQKSVDSDNPAIQEMQELIVSLPGQTLPCENERCEVETLVNRYLGTWSAFLTQQCQQMARKKAENKPYWQQQKDIYQHFESEYVELEHRFGKTDLGSNNLSQRVKNIKPAFSRLPEHAEQACAGINQLVLHALPN